MKTPDLGKLAAIQRASVVWTRRRAPRMRFRRSSFGARRVVRRVARVVRTVRCSHCGLPVRGRCIVETSEDGGALHRIEHPWCEAALYAEAQRRRVA